MSVPAANKLEVWFAGLPSIVQQTLHEPYTWMDDSLKSVSGDPQALLAAAPHYLAYAQNVTRLAGEQLQDRSALAGHWDGDAYQAFHETVDFIDDQLTQLNTALGQVPELLESGAQACVEGANMIIDLVTGLVMFAIGILVTNLALSIVTAGASLAAGVIEVLAAAAKTLASVARVVAKVGEVLAKVAGILERLGVVLRRIQELLKSLETYLKAEKTTAKAAKGLDRIRKQAIFTGKNVAVGQAVKYGTAGTVAPPGGGGSVYHAARDYAAGWSDASDARDVAP